MNKKIHLWANFFLFIFLALGFGTFAQAQQCSMCGKPVTASSNKFVIESSSGESAFGCPGCGLSALVGMDASMHKNAKAEDFLRRTMIDATNAWYLRGTDIGFCCNPFWLSFASKEEAEKFAKGFGGEVLDFQAAIKKAKMDHAPEHEH